MRKVRKGEYGTKVVYQGKQMQRLKEINEKKTPNKRLILGVVVTIVVVMVVGIAIYILTGDKADIGIGSGKSGEISKSYQAPDLDAIDIADYSTVPIYMNDTPFTLPAPMDVLNVTGYTYDAEMEVDAYGYVNIDVTDEAGSVVTVTCKNSEDTPQKITECFIVSIQFTDKSKNCNLYGIAIGDNEEKLVDVLGPCDTIQEWNNSGDSTSWDEWKNYRYEIAGYDVFAEMVVTDGTIGSIIFKYEDTASDNTENTDAVEDVMNTEETPATEAGDDSGNIFFE